MTLKESLQKYQEALTEIDNFFQGHIDGPPEDRTEVWWYIQSGSIHFDYEPFIYEIEDGDNEFETMYSEVFGDVLEVDGYSLINTTDGCGNYFQAILDNSKRVDISNSQQ